MKSWIVSLLFMAMAASCPAGEKHPADHEWEPTPEGILHRTIHSRENRPELYLVCIHGVKVQPHGIMAAEGWEELALDCTVVDRFRGRKQVGERFQFRRYLDGKAEKPEQWIGDLWYVSFVEAAPGCLIVDPQDPTSVFAYRAEAASLVNEHRTMAKKEQAADDQLAKKAPAILAKAKSFSIGGVGEAGEPAEAELALRMLARRPEAAAECQKLLEKASPAGQLYALYGLYWLDREIFKKEIGRFKESKVEVETQEACVVLKSTLGEAAGKIESGELK